MYQNPNEGVFEAQAVVSSIPGKYQRVILKKTQAAQPLKSAARIFRKPLQSAGKSQLGDQSTKASSTKSFSSFKAPKSNGKAHPFGQKEMRFTDKFDLMQLYNKDPGPGSYKVEHQMIEKELQTRIDAQKDMKG